MVQKRSEKPKKVKVSPKQAEVYRRLGQQDIGKKKGK